MIKEFPDSGNNSLHNQTWVSASFTEGSHSATIFKTRKQAVPNVYTSARVPGNFKFPNFSPKL